MPEPKKGDSIKATKGKASQGIKTFESMSSTTEPPKKMKKPKKDGKRVTAKQQNLWIWEPDYKITTAIPMVGILGIVCSIIGTALLGINSTVKEVVVDYTDCKAAGFEETCHDILNIPVGSEKITPNGTTYDIYIDPHTPNGEKINPKLPKLSGKNCICEIPINKTNFGETDWTGDVFLYYGLDNLRQNHRQYVKSRDNKQLLGDMSKIPDANSDIKCTTHFDFAKENIPYFPCGAIANSLFNDTITLQYKDDNGQWKDVPVQKRGIAHPTDKKWMFKNPPEKNITAIGDLIHTTLESLGVEWPKDWGTQQKKIWTTTSSQGRGFENEDFIVWMRTSSTPNFRKLYGKLCIDEDEEKTQQSSGTEEATEKGYELVHECQTAELTEGLPANYEYQFKIEYNYNAKSYGGRKKAILSKVSILGGKNYHGGLIYFMSGLASLLTTIAFVIIKKKAFFTKTKPTV